MKFSKMHGAGNDYVYVNCFDESIEDRPALARFVSDRHFGVGSDGLICICPSDTADFKMDMYNADGSGAQMCGNGIRCLGKYVYDRGLTDKRELTVETAGGLRTLRLNIEDGRAVSARVCMGSPEFSPALIPVASGSADFINRKIELESSALYVTALSLGNPHAVTFTDSLEAVDLKCLGPQIENHSLFPERINAEFVQVIGRSALKLRVWERGSGQTLACGTGAAASLAAACVLGLCGEQAEVMLPGGILFVEWDRKENLIYMTGPAVTVFDGDLY